ncbi:MAG: signal peptidase II [bacterium]|nr:signal peptidase II [bacterium]
MIKFRLSRRGAIFLFLLILMADQFSKGLIQYLFPKWLSVNTGMAWGLFTERNAWWLGLSFLLLGILVFLALKMRKCLWMVVMIWGGGVSNFIDRLVYGGVRDWLRIGWLPAFNLADLAITLGVIFLGASFLRSDDGAD